MRRILAIALCAACAGLGARPAMGQKRAPHGAPHGGSVKAACHLSYKNARKLEQSGQLVKAEKFLRVCAKPKCGVFLEHQCTFAYARIEADMPSVVPTATGPDGKPVMALTFKVDGTVLASRLDGHAVTIDPGLHEFSFVAENRVVSRQKVMVLQGQRNRHITVSVPEEVAVAAAATGQPAAPEAAPPGTPAPMATDAPKAAGAPPKQIETRPPRQAEAEPVPEKEPDISLTAAPPPEPPSRGSRWFTTPSLVLMGVGVAGVGGYGVLTYWGRKDNDDLAQCAPDCPQSSVDHIDNLYLAADISLGVGVAALLGGAYLVWRHHAHYAVEVQPTAGGAVAGVSGAF
ncbi:MAG TPA: hypothetical protein VKB80_07380 [Kofleriaceae bacterium]|nr:hypothetical protein [Kofleriaceae bacterium]